MKAVRARSNIVEKYSMEKFRSTLAARIASIRSDLRQGL
jgi:hypothetical protein